MDGNNNRDKPNFNGGWVKIRPLMDGNEELIKQIQRIKSNVKIRPLMDGNMKPMPMKPLKSDH